ncbi:hypothetical protein HDU98_010955 [Podochytrium sp. JEL0797]|nr:hypothetical protein HDU98_010955 [Podochytrium sp. JEL0797]
MSIYDATNFSTPIIVSDTTVPTTSTTSGSLVCLGGLGVRDIFCTSVNVLNKNNAYTPLIFGVSFFGTTMGTSVTSNSTTFANLMNVTTGTFAAGRYLIHINANISVSSNNTAFGYRVYLNGSTAPSVFTANQTIAALADIINVSSVTLVALTGGSYSVKWDMNRVSGNGICTAVSGASLVMHSVNAFNT